MLSSAVLGGVWSGYTYSAFTTAICVSAVILLSAIGGFCLLRGKPLPKKGLFVLLFLMAGFLRSSYEVHRIEADLRLAKSSSDALTVICKVAETPSIKVLKGRSARYRFNTSDAYLVESGRSFTIPVRVNWYGDKDATVVEVPKRGDRWRFDGRIYSGKRRSGDPYLIINSGEGRSRRLSSSDSGAMAVRIAKLRKGASLRISTGIETWDDVADIHQAVLLGFKDKISRSMRRIFAWSGTIHVFAISGLHIALIASVFVFFVSSCGVPRYYWVYILAPLLLIYTFTTGLRPSAVRACLMALFYFSAPVLHRKFNALSALAATALAVYLFSPSYIFDLGCTLSFSVMLGLIVLFKPLCDLMKRAFKIEALKVQSRLYQVSEEFKKAAQLNRRAGFFTFAAELLAVTISAWLASMPLSAFFFERITPGGLFANMVITPCALMLVTAGVLGFVSSFFSIWLAACFNNAAGFFTTIMIKTATFTSGCKFASFEVENWPLWGVWLWFAMLFLTAWLLRRYIRRVNSDLIWIEKREH